MGLPDGITDKFVYEFKTTANDFWFRFSKPVAHAQADLYGYFFERRLKRVQIFVKDSEDIETWQEDVDQRRAIEVMRKFAALDAGGLLEFPNARKCPSCEFRLQCTVSPIATR